MKPEANQASRRATAMPELWRGAPAFRVTVYAAAMVELVGDYFEMKGVTGQWATYVKLHPRLTLAITAQSRD
jgi:hypothetical protein